MRRLGASLCVLALAGSLHAGVLDDIKSGASSVRDSIRDVKSTKDESKGVVQDAGDLADETAEDVKGALPEKSAEPAQPASGAAAPPPPPSAVAAPPPPPSATQWHIDLGAGQTRAVNQTQLGELIRTGQVGAQTPVFTESLGAWKPAGEVPALAGFFTR
jgi:hypothetical protein